MDIRPRTFTLGLFCLAGRLDKISRYFSFSFSMVRLTCSFVITGTQWPDNGEIDIIEGVNLMTQNQMAVHTLPGHAAHISEFQFLAR